MKNPVLNCIAKSLIFSAPFIFVASYLWISAEEWKYVPAWEVYWLGDQIFKLGFPLTALVLYSLVPPFSGKYLTANDYYLIIPLISLLFILQWTIWLCILRYIYDINSERRVR
jgi:hypothetical protein